MVFVNYCEDEKIKNDYLKEHNNFYYQIHNLN